MKPYHETLVKTAIPADRFTKQAFKNVFCEGPPLCQKALLESPTMIVSSHRSHMDYILLGVYCNRLGYRNLRFAAGDNLTAMPYVGKRITALGAFPVYRDRATSRKYIFELCEEVVAMLDDGDNIIVFPEGGRSYGGAMMEMKSGLIAANIIAHYRSPQNKHCYLPFTISYEILPEIRCFNWIEKGKQLRKERDSLLQKITGNLFYYGADLAAFAKFTLARRFGIRYGNVYIDYAEPFEIDTIIDIRKNYDSKAKNDFFAHKAAIKRVGEEIYRYLTRLYRILPMHVIAYVLKNGSTRRNDIIAKIPAVISLLEKQNKNCKTLNTLSEKELFEQGTDQLRHLNAIQMQNNSVRIRKNDIINYYAQSVEQ